MCWLLRVCSWKREEMICLGKPFSIWKKKLEGKKTPKMLVLADLFFGICVL